MSAASAFVLLDVEGTTTPVDFVFQVLFPYARAHVGEFLEAHASDPDVAADVAGLREEHGRDAAAGRSPPLGTAPWRAPPRTRAG